MDTSITTIDQYIARYPADVQKTLQKIRQTIHAVAPEAQEKISYGLATFTLHGNLVHFGAYDTHYGFYPGAAPIAIMTEELKPFETSKGTVRFPLDKPIPYDLITTMTKLAVQRNSERKKK